MLDDFLVRAGLAGLGVALPAGALGSFVVWRRMAYFGDATAHAALLGVALALAAQVAPFWGIAVVAVLMALLLAVLSDARLGADALLGVLSHGALALGLLAVALVPGGRGNLEAFLFGDVLTVTRAGLAAIWLAGGAIAAILAWRWQALLLATLSPELASAAGYRPAREALLLALLLALLVSVAIKVVGALLVTALLIVPAAAARPLARSPEAMVLVAGTIAAGASLGGLWLAVRLDVAVGPAIVATSCAAFAAIRTIRGSC